jgi:hypothetical protein
MTVLNGRSDITIFMNFYIVCIGKRPFGVSILYMGWDRHYGYQLYQSDPSGNYGGWKATCIGNNSAVSTFSSEHKLIIYVLWESSISTTTSRGENTEMVCDVNSYFLYSIRCILKYSVFCLFSYLFIYSFFNGEHVLAWLRHYAMSHKVTGSIPDEVTGFLSSSNPSSRTTALGSTQPPTEMSTRSLPVGKRRPARKADLTVRIRSTEAFNYLIGTRPHGLLACSIVPQPTTL